MSLVLMRKACAVVGMLSGLGICSQVWPAIVERAVDASGNGPIQLRYGDHTVNSALANGIDVDTYTFAGKAGDHVRINVSDLTASLDAAIELLDPDGNPVGSSFCASGGLKCSTGFDRALTKTGTYTINISDVNSDNAGGYLLNLDARSNFTEIQFKTPFTDRIDHFGDVDFLAFNALGNSKARLSLASLSNGLDAHLEVWDPSGHSILDQFCASGGGKCTTTSNDLPLALTGTYIVAVSDVNADNLGDYQLQVNCVFNVCAVPEPQVTAAILAGLVIASLAGWRRQRA
jgi:hypothetical protein